MTLFIICFNQFATNRKYYCVSYKPHMLFNIIVLYSKLTLKKV